ncbi:hypothetical protein AB0E08_11005 [Streptomyces sp. NPDC048281]|uniref:DUF6907 domain-containing protein n=1 Tax=Streptomyces sp. NPDC048281 TaxID=3154715 RepID=UPI0034266F3E
MSVPRVVVRTSDHGPVTVVCPPWCQGHDGQDGEARVDISHEGREQDLTVPTSRGPATILTTGLEQRPYTEQPPGHDVFVNVEANGQWYPADPEGLEAMASALEEHAAALRALATQLTALRQAGGSA